MREIDVDDLFAEARSQVVLEAEPLFAKIFADALAQQPMLLPDLFVHQAKPSFWVSILNGIGGKGGLAGLGTAALVGVTIGFVQPTSLMTVTDQLFSQTPIEDLDLIPGVDAILSEG